MAVVNGMSVMKSEAPRLPSLLSTNHADSKHVSVASTSPDLP